MPRARGHFIPLAIMLTACMLSAAVVFAPAALATKKASVKCAPIAVRGHVYYVSKTHTVCTFAEKWVARLAGERLSPHSSNVVLSDGPKGFTCQAGTKGASAHMPGIPTDVQISGNCAKGLGLGPSPYFNWVIKSTH